MVAAREVDTVEWSRLKGSWMRLWTVPALDGAVSVVARPLGDENLWGEVEEIRAAGVDVLVPMLEHGEIPILGLLDEELVAPVAGLRFFNLPTVDQEPPASNPSTVELITTLAEIVATGGHVAVHCRAGQGRSPALAAAILVMTGYSAEAAMSALSEVRGHRVPHRSAQRGSSPVEWCSAACSVEGSGGEGR